MDALSKYVLEEEKLRKNLSLIQKVQKSCDVEILFALKAFAGFPLFEIFKEYGFKGTASSVNELKLLTNSIGGKHHACVPVVTDRDIKFYSENTSHLVFNSISQVERFKDKISTGTSIGLRVNPGYSEVEVDLYNPALPHSRLGVFVDEIPEELPDYIKGLHFHALCENDSYALEKVLEVFEEKFGQYLTAVEWLNLGGGHLMTKQGYDFEHLIKIIKGLNNRYPHLKIFMEPGSAFTWQTGYLEVTVEDVITRKDFDIAMLETSFTAHMPDCLEMPYKPSVRGAYYKSNGNKEVILGGNTCLSGDYIRGFWFDEHPKVGDKLIFEDMIHYTMVKTNMFNGVQHPSIVLKKSSGECKLLKEFTFEDYQNRMG